MENVFVYGTLRRGECNHRLIADSTCLATAARIQGGLVDTGHGYPGLLKMEGEVTGELYEVSESQLASMDELEDFFGNENPDNLYNRFEVEVYTDRGSIKAWTYFYNDDSDIQSLAPFSDWKVYHMEKSSLFPYFAYGSCMDVQRIEEAGYLEDFQDVIGRGTLNGFNLQFTKHSDDGGRADIVETGGYVEGKLYRVPVTAIIEYLYIREGVRSKTYRPIIVPVMQQGGEVLEALTFVVADKKTELPPPVKYMKEILRGAEPIVSSEYFTALVERFISSFHYPSGERAD
ncbi:gamma-glutamylcyclotransferase [Paenibacillus alkaliterrae]|uniref:gamma-glutamylcyclotransferase n=1 Tax=Paenibacillus alkaliterrae TaxID=320909 RepID=UPI001F1B036D|nr:gamma-glutamylcyclotransferase [Paenibacillus alkaliterrae]MCF2939453.1 gamma-glutamylcyclotransferase [Paenibacillus alkaliterrae]